MNTENVWILLDRQYLEEPMWRAKESATDEEIIKTEKELGLKFREPYKEFLRKYGGGSVGFCQIYGLKYAPGMDVSINTILANTKFYKEIQKWPDIEDWYVISDDGSGNPIGIDPAGVVWLSDHDSGFEKVKLADDFEGFLHKLLTDTLYQDNEETRHD